MPSDGQQVTEISAAAQNVSWRHLMKVSPPQEAAEKNDSAGQHHKTRQKGEGGSKKRSKS